MYTFPVSNKYKLVKSDTNLSMTQRQLDHWEGIVKSESFDFACNSPMDLETRGPKILLFYTKDGVLHLERISQTGRVLTRTSA